MTSGASKTVFNYVWRDEGKSLWPFPHQPHSHPTCGISGRTRICNYSNSRQHCSWWWVTGVQGDKDPSPSTQPITHTHRIESLFCLSDTKEQDSKDIQSGLKPPNLAQRQSRKRKHLFFICKVRLNFICLFFQISARFFYLQIIVLLLNLHFQGSPMTEKWKARHYLPSNKHTQASVVRQINKTRPEWATYCLFHELRGSRSVSAFPPLRVLVSMC